ncbi:hypothetical protein Anas_07297 [Armadillidium nasatum]|uniref:Uncharacterized protein n=1 Tax=Armadillidium nasatum TaxID=96803 RepID=A0A5N5T4B0_9CRUS|nr:hypothetical protein Anas_07297 [Armadillidium nasatum]
MENILGGWQGLGSSRMGNDDLLNVDDPETHEIDRDSKHRCPFCYYKSRFKRNIKLMKLNICYRTHSNLITQSKSSKSFAKLKK